MVEVPSRTKESFQQLAVAQLPALYSRARTLVRDEAEDLVQETLLRAYRAYGSLADDAAGGRWLKTILVNVFRDQLRKQARSLDELPVGTSRASRSTARLRRRIRSRTRIRFIKTSSGRSTVVTCVRC